MAASAAFRARFGDAATRTFWAPARVNLIGEHIDYCGGTVLPMPLQFGTSVEVAPVRRPTIRVFSTRPNDSIEVHPDMDPLPRFPERHWGNYVAGVIAEIRRAGGRPGGADVFVDADIPASGLSSSASFTVALMTAFAATSHTALDGLPLALASQRVEHEWAGVKCGIMDQAVAVLGTRGAALRFDTATGDALPVVLPEPRPEIVVVDSGKARQLAETRYNERRRDTERAAAGIGVPVERLAHAAPEMLATAPLDERARRRASHVIGEHRRVLAACDAILAGDWRELGRLFVESHESLRTAFEVSCEELDVLVAAAMECEGVEGARLTGAGFGGAAVVLVWPDRIAEALEHIEACYAARYGITPTSFVAESGGGATERPMPLDAAR
jgi:galactokinase